MHKIGSSRYGRTRVRVHPTNHPRGTASARTIKATPFVTGSLEGLRESLLHFEGGSMKGGPPLGQGTDTCLLVSPSTLTGTRCGVKEARQAATILDRSVATS